MENEKMKLDQVERSYDGEVGETSQPCDTVYVGNIPWKINEYKLGKFFEQFCEVYSTRIIRDKGTARSRGFGFIDIETTGLSKHRNTMTTLSVWDGKETGTYINGQNMNEESLADEMKRHKMFVSFNGTGFDLPFIQAKFPSLDLEKPHMDLRWVGNKVGLRGGLKRIEREVGINRGDDVADIDGSMAVRLWKKWERTGNKEALDLLVKYNQEDVINLETLGNIIYKRIINKI